jgi:hypothetical protein
MAEAQDRRYERHTANALAGALGLIRSTARCFAHNTWARVWGWQLFALQSRQLHVVCVKIMKYIGTAWLALTPASTHAQRIQQTAV